MKTKQLIIYLYFITSCLLLGEVSKTKIDSSSFCSLETAHFYPLNTKITLIGTIVEHEGKLWYSKGKGSPKIALLEGLSKRDITKLGKLLGHTLILEVSIKQYQQNIKDEKKTDFCILDVTNIKVYMQQLDEVNYREDLIEKATGKGEIKGKAKGVSP